MLSSSFCVYGIEKTPVISKAKKSSVVFVFASLTLLSVTSFTFLPFPLDSGKLIPDTTTFLVSESLAVTVHN